VVSLPLNFFLCLAGMGHAVLAGTLVRQYIVLCSAFGYVFIKLKPH
jgi:hypothetical protein